MRSLAKNCRTGKQQLQCRLAGVYRRLYRQIREGLLRTALILCGDIIQRPEVLAATIEQSIVQNRLHNLEKVG